MMIVFVFIHFPWWGLKQELILLLEISYVFSGGRKSKWKKSCAVVPPREFFFFGSWFTGKQRKTNISKEADLFAKRGVVQNGEPSFLVVGFKGKSKDTKQFKGSHAIWRIARLLVGSQLQYRCLSLLDGFPSTGTQTQPIGFAATTRMQDLPGYMSGKTCVQSPAVNLGAWKWP